jgi:hypothetical protein
MLGYARSEASGSAAKPKFILFPYQTTPIMTRYLPILLLSLFCGLLLWSGCKKDDDNTCWDESNPECANYDPCWDKRTPVSAEFEVFTRMRDTLFLDFDTLVYPGSYLFRASDTSAEYYYWTIGNDARVFTSRDVNLSFDCDSGLGFSDFYVTLITERMKDTTCTSEEFLRDTVVKSYTFVKQEHAAIWGKYRGSSSDNPGVVYDIEIDFECGTHPCMCLFDTGLPPILIYNLTNHGCWQRANTPLFSNHAMYSYYLFGAKVEDGCVLPASHYMSMSSGGILFHVFGRARDSIEVNFIAQYLYVEDSILKADQFDVKFIGERVN